MKPRISMITLGVRDLAAAGLRDQDLVDFLAETPAFLGDGHAGDDRLHPLPDR